MQAYQEVVPIVESTIPREDESIVRMNRLSLLDGETVEVKREGQEGDAAGDIDTGAIWSEIRVEAREGFDHRARDRSEVPIENAGLCRHGSYTRSMM
jgi:hypothetical protein